MAHFTLIPRSPLRGPLRDPVRDPVRQAIVSAAFISNWQTDNTGTSTDSQISLPLEASGTYNFLVDWGDSSSDTITVFNQAEVTHTYAAPGNFTVTITGTINGWRFNDAGDEEKLLNISNWGPLLLGNGGDYFDGCTNLTITAMDILDISAITNMNSAFKFCSSLTNIPNMDMWDTSSVTTFSNTFNGTTVFNQSLDSWDVSAALDMSKIFVNATAFNGNITSWIVSAVTDMNSAFEGAPAFNQAIGVWDVSSVTNMSSMFQNAAGFNQAINAWTVTALTNTNSMFNGATIFDQDISGWNVINLTQAVTMFTASAFSQTNYDLLLVAWDALALQSGVIFGVGTAMFSTAGPATARTNMKSSDLWVITDGGFDVTSISGLELWLDAADTATITGHPGAVSQWDDKSGNGRDVTQGTGSAQPASGTNTLNSLNVITTDGSDTMLIPSGIDFVANGPNTRFVLCRRASEDASNDNIFTITQGGPARVSLQYSSTSGRISFVHNTSNALTFSNGNTNTNFQVIMGRRSGTTQALAVDGGTEATNTTATNVTSITDRDLFALNQISSFLTGDMAEALLYSQSLSAGEISEIVDIYMTEKWGVP